jgi:hypothetical protein
MEKWIHFLQYDNEMQYNSIFSFRHRNHVILTTKICAMKENSCVGSHKTREKQVLPLTLYAKHKRVHIHKITGLIKQSEEKRSV